MTSINFPRLLLTCSIVILMLLAKEAIAEKQINKLNNEEAFEEDDGEIFEGIYGDEELVSIASGASEPIYKAPSVASVITRKDIEHMGFLTLEEALEVSAGIHVSRYTLAYNPLYIFRGIYSGFNQQVLLLIDGQPMTRLYNRDRGTSWGDLPTASIERIEVIHGPGSAIYGADAYAGVINVITMAPDTGKESFGIRAGNQSTINGWINNKFQFGDIPSFISLEYRHTDGRERTIELDGQSLFDTLFSTDASHAPGKNHLDLEALDLRIRSTLPQLYLNLGVQVRHDIGTGTGASSVLDPYGSQSAVRTNFVLQTKPQTTRWENLTTHTKISYAHSEDSQKYTLFPAGAMVAYGGPLALHPDGMRGSPLSREWDIRFDQSFLYTGLDSHELRFDVGYHYGELYDTSESKNFDSFGQPLGEMVDVTNNPELVYMIPRNQRASYFLVQDRWNIAADWDATLGIRIDKNSYYGTSVNPRATFIWQYSYDTVLKFLYGSAFRAPSFLERYIINNPVLIGNPDLDPESIDSFDLSIIKMLGFSKRLQVNFFRSELDDLIQLAEQTNGNSQLIFANSEARKSSGIEVEYEHQFFNDNFIGDSKLVVNFARQKVVTKDGGTDLGNYPHNNGTIRYTRGIENSWRYSLVWNWVSSRQRGSDDYREKLEGYHTVDVKLSKTLSDGSDLSLIIKNIADANLKEPSILGAFLPNDLPTGKRLALIEFKIGL